MKENKAMTKPLNYYGFAFDDPRDSYNEKFLATDEGKQCIIEELESKDRLQQQLAELGFDDSECWDLGHTIAQFIMPRIKRLKEITHGYPSHLTEEAWNEILDKMVWSMEERIKDDLSNYNDEEYQNRFQEGFNLLGKYFRHLWD